LGELALAAWLFLVAYIIWFFALAKDYVPLTSIETTILCKLHKRQTHCFSTNFEKVRRKKKVVGFRCACGYEYLSKRSVTDEHKHQTCRERVYALLGKNQFIWKGMNDT